MKIIKKLKYIITFFLIIILIISFFLVKRNLNNKKYQNNPDFEDKDIVALPTNDTIKEASKLCCVDIKGAISKPGVYQIACDKNINDVIDLAGGLTAEANTSVINLAKKITNEMVIIIYTNEEVKNSNIVDTVVKVVEKECHCPNIKNDACINDKLDQNIGEDKEESKDKKDSNELININQATLEELMNIPKIGESKAKAIIEYRKNNGKFLDIKDILNVSGIGDKLYEEIKIYITT